MSLMNKLDIFEAEFSLKWKEYLDLNKELDLYRGKDLGGIFEEVNILLNKIQDAYINLHPALAFILNRSKMALNAVEDHNRFVESLKLSGATEQENASA